MQHDDGLRNPSARTQRFWTGHGVGLSVLASADAPDHRGGWPLPVAGRRSLPWDALDDGTAVARQGRLSRAGIPLTLGQAPLLAGRWPHDPAAVVLSPKGLHASSSPVWSGGLEAGLAGQRELQQAKPLAERGPGPEMITMVIRTSDDGTRPRWMRCAERGRPTFFVLTFQSVQQSADGAINNNNQPSGRPSAVIRCCCCC